VYCFQYQKCWQTLLLRHTSVFFDAPYCKLLDHRADDVAEQNLGSSTLISSLVLTSTESSYSSFNDPLKYYRRWLAPELMSTGQYTILDRSKTTAPDLRNSEDSVIQISVPFMVDKC
jgi:hypothetical protein